MLHYDVLITFYLYIVYLFFQLVLFQSLLFLISFVYCFFLYHFPPPLTPAVSLSALTQLSNTWPLFS